MPSTTTPPTHGTAARHGCTAGPQRPLLWNGIALGAAASLARLRVGQGLPCAGTGTSFLRMRDRKYACTRTPAPSSTSSSSRPP